MDDLPGEDALPDADIYNRKGVLGLPDVTINDFGVEVLMPETVVEMSFSELMEQLQHFGALCSRANTILAALAAKVILLRQHLEDETNRPLLAAQRDKEMKGTKDELRLEIILGDPALQKVSHELTRTLALRALAEGQLAAYDRARDTLSRQFEGFKSEASPRGRNYY